MIVIALLDNAFFSKVTSVEEIYRTRVHAPRHSLEFKWHSDKLKAPIFRQAERTGTGIETSPTKALRYSTYLYYLQCLGMVAGFMQILASYFLRRGGGEAAEGIEHMWDCRQVPNY